MILTISSPYLLEPLTYAGVPIYYKYNSIYGYIMPAFNSSNKVLFFYSNDGQIDYMELEEWHANKFFIPTI